MGTNDNFQLSTFNFQLIRVGIVDDQTAVAEGFERLINESGVAGVTGKAYSVSGCWKLLTQCKADVFLLDVSLPDGNGIDLFPQIKTRYPDIKVIIEGIQTVVSGEKFLCKETKKMLKHSDSTTVLLSRREQELLRLIVAGESGHKIADILCLGYETIKSYRKRLMFKLGVSNSAELVRMAIEQKLL